MSSSNRTPGNIVFELTKMLQDGTLVAALSELEHLRASAPVNGVEMQLVFMDAGIAAVSGKDPHFIMRLIINEKPYEQCFPWNKDKRQNVDGLRLCLEKIMREVVTEIIRINADGNPIFKEHFV